LIIKIELKDLEKYNLTTVLGSFGKVKLIVKWNSFASKWVLGMEYTTGEAIFYGQSLYPNFDLFKPFRNKGVPKGRLFLVDNIQTREIVIDPTLENIEEFSLIYMEN